MVEVVRDRLREIWPLDVNCAKCQSDLKIELTDLRYGGWKVSGYHFDGTAVIKYLYTFRCPCCGTEANGNEVDPHAIPDEVRQTLQTAERERRL
jgi:hypothetical protein